MSSRQLLKSVFQARLVLGPFPTHEDEVVEHHARSNHRNVFQALFQDDVDVAVTGSCVADPPEIGPIGVDLVIGDQDHALGEIAFETAVGELAKLASDTGIAGDADDGGSEEVCSCDENEGEVLFAHGLPGVKVIFVVKVERSS